MRDFSIFTSFAIITRLNYVITSYSTVCLSLLLNYYYLLVFILFYFILFYILIIIYIKGQEMKRNKKGFSLLELLLTLGIIAALIIAAFIVYPKVQAAQRAESELKNVATIQAGVKSLYSGMANYQGLNNSVLINANVFPENLLKDGDSGTQAVNAFGGNVEVKSTSASGIADAGISIKYYNVPSDECIRIATALANNVSSVRINNIATTYTSLLATKCSSTNSNTIEIVSL